MIYPQLDEFVIGKVKKVLPFGAIIGLEEYGGLESFVHISEVSSGWIRNIREHLKEGQVIVGKVVALDTSKNQVDISIKRISEAEKKRKLEEWQNSKRAQKLLEITLSKSGKTLKQAEAEVKALVDEFGSLFDVFDALAKGTEVQAKVSKTLLSALEETAKKEIKPKQFSVRRILKLASYAPDGVEHVKKLLSEVLEFGAKVHYVGAPRYFVDITSLDPKTAEKAMQKIEAFIEKSAKGADIEWSLEKEK
ncbi:translation initiation factor IF-2 subunit alpha [Candidatus Micrarchaeota archaeon]|nr:translation initiation factor IF-2 subunit alpha [Candidatus Micrarchaeota archaeon]